MATVDVTIRGEPYVLDFPHDPTEAEINAAAAEIGAGGAARPSEAASGGHPVLATVARTALPVLGGVAGALSPVPGGAYLGGGLMGAAGEALGEYLEGQPLDPKEIGLMGGASAMPFVGRARTMLGGAALRGAQGGTLAGATSVARDWLHDREIDLSEVLRSVKYGVGAGALLGAGEGALVRRAALRDLQPGGVAVPSAGTAKVPGGVRSPFERPPGYERPAAYVPPSREPWSARAGAPSGATEVPSLGQLGLPGVVGLREAPGIGALSSADPGSLSPSIIDDVDLPEDVRAVVGKLADRNSVMIETARRGVQTTAQREAAAEPIIAELAHRIGTSPRSFVATLRKRGEAINAEQMHAVRTIFTAVTHDFTEVSKQVAGGARDTQTMLRMAKAMNLAKYVLAQRAGAQAEAGRALNAVRGASGVEGLRGKELTKLLRTAGTTQANIVEVARRAAMLDAGDPMAMTRYLRETVEATTSDKIYEAWINGLLSGTQTHLVNNISNALALGLRLPEEVAAGTLDALRAGVTGHARERFVGEAVADGLGMARGLIGGARVALRSFRTELPEFGGRRVESNPFAIRGKLGSTVRMPSRVMLASDEFWKAMSVEGSVYGQAYREAAKGGYTGGARTARMAELIRSERSRLVDVARPEALYRTFQQEGRVASAIGGLRKIPGVRYLLPFVRTPVNVASFGIERSPLGLGMLASKAWKGQAKPGELTDGLARMSVGMGLAGGLVALMEQGQLTGAPPRDHAEWNALRSTGWLPYSVKVGQTYVPFNRVEPVGSVLGWTVDAGEAMRDPLVDPEEMASRLGFVFANRLIDQTFLMGLQDTLDAVDDPERYGATFLKRFAGSAVPAGVAQAARAIDPTYRDGRSLGNLLASRTPGLSEDVPAVIDIWGEERQRGVSGIGALVMPMDIAHERQDPASVEVRRLVESVGFGVGSPARGLKREDQLTERLSFEEYDAYSRESGKIAFGLVTKVVQGGAYQKSPSDEVRAGILSEVFEAAREMARGRLLLRRAQDHGGQPLPLAMP
jgi:hypothetical protein